MLLLGAAVLALSTIGSCMEKNSEVELQEVVTIPNASDAGDVIEPVTEPVTKKPVTPKEEKWYERWATSPWMGSITWFTLTFGIWVPVVWYYVNHYRMAPFPGNSLSGTQTPFWKWSLPFGIAGTITGAFHTLFAMRPYLNKENEKLCSDEEKKTKLNSTLCCSTKGLDVLTKLTWVSWLAGQLCAPFIAIFPLGGTDSSTHDMFAYSMFPIIALSILLFCMRSFIVKGWRSKQSLFSFAACTTTTGFLGMTLMYLLNGTFKTYRVSQADCIRESEKDGKYDFFGNPKAAVCYGERTSLPGDKHCAVRNKSYDAIAELCNVDLDVCAETTKNGHQCEIMTGKQTLFKKVRGECRNADAELRNAQDPCQEARAYSEIREDGSHVLLKDKDFGANCTAITDDPNIDGVCEFIPTSVNEAKWHHWCNYQGIALAVFFLFGIALATHICCRKKDKASDI